MRKALLFILPMLAMTLAGCATPRYQTLYQYEGPVDAAGRACLQTCEPKLANCQANCRVAYQSCLKSAAPAIEKRYRETLKEYESAMNQYRHELSMIQFQMSMEHSYYAQGYGYGYSYDPFWPAPYYAPPPRPQKPDHDKIAGEVIQQQCNHDCGCQPIYDACFLSCGGKKVSDIRCIANCPKP